jgi:hypothetical protein
MFVRTFYKKLFLMQKNKNEIKINNNKKYLCRVGRGMRFKIFK